MCIVLQRVNTTNNQKSTDDINQSQRSGYGERMMHILVGLRGEIHAQYNAHFRAAVVNLY